MLERGDDGWTLAFLEAPPVALLLDYHHKETKKRIIRYIIENYSAKNMSHLYVVHLQKEKKWYGFLVTHIILNSEKDKDIVMMLILVDQNHKSICTV